MAESKGEVFVEEVAQEFGHAQVGPPAVDKEQSFQVSELGDAVIRGENSLSVFFNGKKSASSFSLKQKKRLVWIDLHSFLTANANSNVSRFNHGDVISAITDRQRHSFFVFLHQIDDHGFLEWSHSATNHCFTYKKKSNSNR